MARRGTGGVATSGLEEKGKIDRVLGGTMRSGRGETERSRIG